AKSWTVTVDAAAPRVKRTLEVAMPEKPEDDLRIRLRDTIVLGTVVDEAGKPVGSEVGVNMSGKGELIQVDVSPDGSFAFHGVDPGPYTLQADGYLLQSDATDISVAEEGVMDGVRLVVKPVRKVIGRVIAGASPVAGARVTVVPADVPFLTALTRDTDER